MKMVSRRAVRRAAYVVASLAAVSAVLAAPGLAQAATVTLHENASGGTVLAPGAAIRGFSSNLEFTAAWGILKCTENEFNGSVAENPGEPAAIEIESGRFEGTGGGPCASTIAGGAVTMEWQSQDLPWFIELDGSGRSLITGSPAVDIGMTFLVGSTPIAYCDYEAAEIADTFNFGSALVDTISGQTMTLNASTSEGECAPSGTLAGSFNVTHNGSAVVATTP